MDDTPDMPCPVEITLEFLGARYSIGCGMKIRDHTRSFDGEPEHEATVTEAIGVKDDWRETVAARQTKAEVTITWHETRRTT
jgi:hypothetical protein